VSSIPVGSPFETLDEGQKVKGDPTEIPGTGDRSKIETEGRTRANREMATAAPSEKKVKVDVTSMMKNATSGLENRTVNRLPSSRSRRARSGD
jgi:hypothetical protein